MSCFDEGSVVIVIVLTTMPADADAEQLGRTLVEERLAACVNVLPVMTSIYRWQGAVEQASERQLIMKTTSARVDELKTRLAALHPYDVPEILVLPVSDGGSSYLKWLAESTTRAEARARYRQSTPDAAADVERSWRKSFGARRV
jgi:periplasmic divalent cation tolerance protein